MSSDAWKSVPFPVPTLDRPFGIEIWPLFEKLWMSLRTFTPQDFRFIPGTTPMSTLKETAAVLISYYIIVFGGRELMKNRPAFKFNAIFKVHNLALTIISGGLLALFTEQLLPTVWRNGIFFAICNADGGWTPRLVTLYYVSNTHCVARLLTNNFELNYITKYVELFDTVFLVLKKKPLSRFFNVCGSLRLTDYLQRSSTHTIMELLHYCAIHNLLDSPQYHGFL